MKKLKAGMRVKSERFGFGTVFELTGNHRYDEVEIRFDKPNFLLHSGESGKYTDRCWRTKRDCTSSIWLGKLEILESNSCERVLHIEQDGKVLYASILNTTTGDVERVTKSKCHPDDEFDFETGVRLAIDILFGKEPIAELPGLSKEEFMKKFMGEKVFITFANQQEFIDCMKLCDEYGLLWNDGKRPVIYINKYKHDIKELYFDYDECGALLESDYTTGEYGYTELPFSTYNPNK